MAASSLHPSATVTARNGTGGRRCFGRWPAARWAIGLIGLSVVLTASGCRPGKEPKATPAAGVVRLTVINLGSCEWQIAVTARRNGRKHLVRFGAGAERVLDVPGGEYLVEQTALTDALGPGRARRFAMHLENNHAYRWSLATLQPAGGIESEIWQGMEQR